MTLTTPLLGWFVILRYDIVYCVQQGQIITSNSLIITSCKCLENVTIIIKIIVIIIYYYKTVGNLFLQDIIIKADLCTLGTRHSCHFQFIICHSQQQQKTVNKYCKSIVILH